MGKASSHDIEQLIVFSLKAAQNIASDFYMSNCESSGGEIRYLQNLEKALVGVRFNLSGVSFDAFMHSESIPLVLGGVP